MGCSVCCQKHAGMATCKATHGHCGLSTPCSAMYTIFAPSTDLLSPESHALPCVSHLTPVLCGGRGRPEHMLTLALACTYALDEASQRQASDDGPLNLTLGANSVSMQNKLVSLSDSVTIIVFNFFFSAIFFSFFLSHISNIRCC